MIAIVAGIGFFVLAITIEFIIRQIDGPEGRTKKIVNLLQNDSTELEKEYFASEGTTPPEMLNAVRSLNGLTSKYRHCNQKGGSALIDTDPHTSALMKHNVEQSRQLLTLLTPTYRQVFAKWLDRELKVKNPSSAVTLADGDQTLLVYSIRYLKEDEYTSDYPEYDRFIEGLGFKKAVLGMTPGHLEHVHTYN